MKRIRPLLYATVSAQEIQLTDLRTGRRWRGVPTIAAETDTFLGARRSIVWFGGELDRASAEELLTRTPAATRGGAGPGEFRRPSKIAVTARGTIIVYDRELARVSEFDANGVFLRQCTIDDTNITDIAVSDTLLWAARLVMSASSPFLRSYRLRDGAAVSSVASRLSAAEVALSSGDPGRVRPSGEADTNPAWPVVRHILPIG